MKKKIFPLSVFLLSLASLLISLGLFWNMGIFVDEHGVSPVDVSGGELWNLADWARLFLLAVLCLISAVWTLKKPKE